MSGKSLEVEVDPRDPEVDEDTSLVGETVQEKYFVEALLGEGRVGRVYRARNTRVARDVALKVLRDVFDGDDRMKHRFVREARAAGRIEHPNVVKVWDVGLTERKLPFIVMELLRGEPLAARIRRQQRLPVEDVLSLGRQLLDGLGAAHRAGIVHRDVMPGNVLLVEDGPLKIVDFGIAHFLGGDSTQITVSGELVGSPNYLAPEQAEGGSIGDRADAWGATAVIYEMLTGAPPFARGAIFDTLKAVVSEPHRPPSELRGDLLPGFDELVEAGLTKDPAARASTGELLAMLLRIGTTLSDEELRDTQRRPSMPPDGTALEETD